MLHLYEPIQMNKRFVCVDSLFTPAFGIMRVGCKLPRMYGTYFWMDSYTKLTDIWIFSVL